MLCVFGGGVYSKMTVELRAFVVCNGKGCTNEILGDTAVYGQPKRNRARVTAIEAGWYVANQDGIKIRNKLDYCPKCCKKMEADSDIRLCF